MQCAMIIVPPESRPYEHGRALADFLKRECGQRYVVEVDDAWKRKPDDMRSLISFHAIRAGRQPFLLAYLGHGWHDGWYYAKEDKRTWMSLPYDWLEGLLKSREGPTLVLNDTCHAGSLAERVRAWKDPHETCVIAAAPPKGYAFGQMTPDIIESWRNGDSYEPRRRTYRGDRAFWERRIGVAHDKFFLARPA